MLFQNVVASTKFPSVQNQGYRTLGLRGSPTRCLQAWTFTQHKQITLPQRREGCQAFWSAKNKEIKSMVDKSNMRKWTSGQSKVESE